MTESKNILLIGGHGKVALLATPKLIDEKLNVTSLFRNPDHQAEVEALGATPLVQDVTKLSTEEWAELLKPFDVVVWSAGNGGKNGADATYAIDRDAAVASIDGAAALGDDAPSYIMVSYAGATKHNIDPSDSFYPYAESKKTADEHLAASGLDYLILGPGVLTLDEETGIRVIDEVSTTKGDSDTARALVASVITEFAVRDFPGDRTLEFYDGEDKIASIA